ncbi:MAG: hypothetical protein HZC19_01230 [Candidatus Omnitrophica bacterium]|nr:hypothetical protein [Candidatus Omnitrophota bacterium]
MSIIQEALKKAQRKEAHEIGPVKIGSASKKAPSFKIMPIFIAALITVSIVATRQFSTKPGFGLFKNTAKVDFVETAPHQEIVYKPIVEKVAKPDEPHTKPTLILNGIMYLEDGPQAIINDALVREGDIVKGATVIKINKDSVVLTLNDVEMTLILKK